MEAIPDSLLLSTRLKIPAPRKNYIIRRGLFKKLSVCDELSVVFICGGAGTGKTTLLSTFIRERAPAKVGWLSLDETIDNVHSFWLYFTAAIKPFLPAEDGLFPFMRSNMDVSHLEDLLVMQVNHLWGDEDYYLVLDDVHYLKDKALVKTLEFFIQAMPPNLHIFMLSREDPPIYLGPLAVSGRLLYIDSKQMLLSPQEGMAFLRQTLALQGSEGELDKLNSYGEGWIGGLQLAAAAGFDSVQAGELLRAGGGIASQYLTREIFQSLNPREQEFLLGTGFLPYFDAGLCRKLFPGYSPKQFKEMMEGLIKKNLFVVWVDERNEVYRYHNILAEYLTQQLANCSEERRRDLYLAAAQAYEERGDWEEALKQYIGAGDWDSTLELAGSLAGKIEVLGHLDRAPLDKLIEKPDLAAQCFIYHLGNLETDSCRRLFAKFEERYGGEDLFRALKFAEVFFTRDISSLPKHRTMTAAQIDALPFGNMVKAFMLTGNSISLLWHMQYEEAEKCINIALANNKGSNLFADFYARDQLAQIFEETGRLNDSLACYRRVKEALTPLMLCGADINYYFGITGVHMLRMELTEAEQSLAQVQRILERERGRSKIADINMAFHLAEMEILRGNAEAGLAAVYQMVDLYPELNALTLTRLIHELDCAGVLTEELAEGYLRTLQGEEAYQGQPFLRLTRARILYGRGRTGEALGQCDAVLAFSRERKNLLRLVEAALLKVYFLSGQRAHRRERLNLLREAIHYAAKDRILLPFFLEKQVLLPFLKELASEATKDFQQGEIEFIKDAISICGGTPVCSAPLLSPRELEVLAELARGITNREIGERLFISQATVKSHLLSIYSKLNVSTRVAAVEAGRNRNLVR